MQRYDNHQTATTIAFDPSIKQDSLATCFERIGKIISGLEEDAQGFEAVAMALGGSWPTQEQNAGAGVGIPDPQHALWRAHSIETRLEALISRNRASLDHMRASIG